MNDTTPFLSAFHNRPVRPQSSINTDKLVQHNIVYNKAKTRQRMYMCTSTADTILKDLPQQRLKKVFFTKKLLGELQESNVKGQWNPRFRHWKKT